jgi:hypothetical protein
VLRTLLHPFCSPWLEKCALRSVAPALLDKNVQPIGSVALELLDEMPVEVGGHSDRRMSEARTDRLEVDARLDAEHRPTVAQRMKVHALETRAFRRAHELLAERIRIQRAAFDVCEDPRVAVPSPAQPEREARFCLRSPMLTERVEHKGRRDERTTREVRLRLFCDELAVDALQGPRNQNRTAIEIQV